jgi:hypothetical protein
MVEAAQSGRCKIHTSSVSLAEVCKLPELGMLPIEQTEKILDFFKNSYVELWAADMWVCREAHHITRLIGLMPMDAIHIATAAMFVKADVLITTDTKKYRRNGLLAHNEKIGNPPLKISLPDRRVLDPNSLFSEGLKRKNENETRTGQETGPEAEAPQG